MFLSFQLFLWFFLSIWSCVGRSGFVERHIKSILFFIFFRCVWWTGASWHLCCLYNISQMVPDPNQTMTSFQLFIIFHPFCSHIITFWLIMVDVCNWFGYQTGFGNVVFLFTCSLALFVGESTEGQASQYPLYFDHYRSFMHALAHAFSSPASWRKYSILLTEMSVVTSFYKMTTQLPE
jgi:hypothetical protein